MPGRFIRITNPPAIKTIIDVLEMIIFQRRRGQNRKNEIFAERTNATKNARATLSLMRQPV